MKFPYIPLDIIVDEAAGELKRLNRMGGFSKDDAYNQAVECARLIGGNAYTDESVTIKVVGHVGVLPKAFYTALEVWKVSEMKSDATNVLDYFRDTVGKTYLKDELMVPGDSATVRLHKDKARTPALSPVSQSYTFKVPPGLIRTSFHSGYVGLKYSALPTSEQGVVCIQDEPHATKAAKEYIKMMHLEEGWMNGEVANHVYQSIKGSYESHLDIAKGIQKAIDPSHIDYHVAQVHNRYRGFKL